MNLPETISQCLKMKRNKKKWSQKQMGDYLGVSNVQVCKYESAMQEPPWRVIKKILELK